MDAADAPVLWTPPEALKTTRAIRRFIDGIERRCQAQIGQCYWNLHNWSCDNYPEFWAEVWDFTGVVHSKTYSQVIDKHKKVTDRPEWFHGARLNYAENLLRHPDDEKTAIYFAGEMLPDVGVRSISFGQLRGKVEQYARALRGLGVKIGDVVAGYLPNTIETVVCMLATSKLGAVWSSTSPDFGVEGVLERLGQVKPKVLFSVNAVRYNGKVHQHTHKAQRVVQDLPTLEHVVILPFLPMDEQEITTNGSVNGSPENGEANSEIDNDTVWLNETEFLDKGNGMEPVSFEQLPFNHPLFIMFSSGTTGKPKCMVHCQGGTLLKHLAEHVLQGSLTAEDKLFFYTTAGWMMWNWMVGALATGASIVVYDGSPFLPRFDTLFDVVDKIGVTGLGMGAKCFSILEQKGVRPRETHKLTNLHTIYSTGSPLNPDSFDYIYRDIKSDLILSSISGGTDIVGCFMGANPLLPVHRGQIPGPFLGCRLYAFNPDDGSVVEPGAGDGELVCTVPIPSMPTHFLDDPIGKRYELAYFGKYKDVWAHGDLMKVDPKTGGITMLGRSDGTLNPGGVRFGSAEIYNIVEQFTAIDDSVCVGQRIGLDERVILFLKMKPNQELTDEFVAKLKSTIRISLSPRHVPAVILPIQDIPYTVSGKKVEIAVRKIISGDEVLNASALRNPESLAHFRNIPQLKL